MKLAVQSLFDPLASLPGLFHIGRSRCITLGMHTEYAGTEQAELLA